MPAFRDKKPCLYNYRSIRTGDMSADMIVGYKIRPSANTILKNENIEDYLKL